MSFSHLLLAALAAFGSPQPPPAAGTVAIVGADVLPMTWAERLADQVVIVRGDQIVAVGPRGSVAVPSDAARIEAAGLTLMPGLVDMHLHIENPAGEQGDAIERALAVTLAHGVTTVRAASGAPEGPALRARIERGEIAGPRLYAGTPHINSQNTPDVAAARARVAEARTGGFDFVKIHEISDPAVWQVMIDESARAGLPAIGHVTDRIGFFRALAGGQQVEHFEGVARALVPADSPALRETFGQIPSPHLVRYLAQVSDADIARLAARARALGGYHGPTLGLFEHVFDAVTPTDRLLAEPGMRFASRAVVDHWAQQRGELIESGGVTAESGRVMRDLRRRIFRAFHLAGISMFAGSGAPILYQPYGASLIREIETMADAGLGTMDALRAATLVPRDYFRSLVNGGSSQGWRADFGTVEAGARADLILLRGDPSRDLAALRNLQTVIAGGRVYDRAALDALLDQAVAASRR